VRRVLRVKASDREEGKNNPERVFWIGSGLVVGIGGMAGGGMQRNP